MGKRHVLITGSAGRVASILRQHWGDRYRLRLADVRLVEDLALHEEYVELDITDLEAFTAACGGIDTVLHLAADPSPKADFYQSLLSLNIIGGYNGFEAARRAGCRRLVFASSINAVLGYGQDGQAASWEVPIYPQNVYGATKCWGEALARVYGHEHALSCICMRLHSPSTRAISPKTPRMEASARGMRPICSLPVSMPMKRSASILSMAPRATKTTGSWSVRRIHAWPTSLRTARRSSGHLTGHILDPSQMSKKR